jgi:poly-gamma-glutamate synthesis protein (capsule biosynthesis protein)
MQQLRPQVDVLMVMPNWGDEYVSVPNKLQQTWARLFVDWGADIVVGDQAHWVQSAEFYQDKFISYGLGNLIFDQSWSQNTREGLIERFIYHQKRLVAIDIIPVYLNDSWFTSIAPRENIRSILEKLRVR